MQVDDARQIVRTGYDRIARAYPATRRAGGADVELLRELLERLPDGARVLDAGCGAGVPVTRLLAKRCAVTGVDISEKQVELARELVPGATFVVGDIAALAFADASFDAVVSYYAIIHVPRNQHATVLRGFARVLRPGGLLLLSTGAGESAGDVEDDWLGAGAPMYWSHYGRDTNLQLLREAGFTIVWERLMTDDEVFGGGTHLFVLARK
jgi:ubiquinone/menaquinone biosynthesis C-methylase UbiE